VATRSARPGGCVKQAIVREQFFMHTPAEGTPEQIGHLRRQKFLRALEYAEQKRLVGIEEIDGTGYLRLIHPDPQEDED
jgi:hypothetical protein